MLKNVMSSFVMIVLLSSVLIMANPVHAQVPSADLSVSITSDTDPPVANAPLTYTITTTNNGPDQSDVIITDTLPPSVTFDTGLSDPSCSVATGNIVTCVLGTMAYTDSSQIMIVVDVGSITSLTNQVTVSGSVSDPDLSNNSVTITQGSITPPPPVTIQSLIDLVKSFNLKKDVTHALIDPLQDIQKDLDKKNHEKDKDHDKDKNHEKDKDHDKADSSCSELKEFIKLVNKKEMRNKLTADQANQLITGATQLQSSFGCN